MNPLCTCLRDKEHQCKHAVLELATIALMNLGLSRHLSDLTAAAHGVVVLTPVTVTA